MGSRSGSHLARRKRNHLLALSPSFWSNGLSGTQRTVKPYILRAGEGRVYRWHDVRVEVKAGVPELGGVASITETVTRKGEEPHEHVHETEDETFYLLEGRMTLHVDGADFEAAPGAFAFVPKGTPHTYTITSDGDVRYLCVAVPGTFGEHIERTGERIE